QIRELVVLDRLRGGGAGRDVDVVVRVTRGDGVADPADVVALDRKRRPRGRAPAVEDAGESTARRRRVGHETAGRVAEPVVVDVDGDGRITAVLDPAKRAGGGGQGHLANQVVREVDGGRGDAADDPVARG